MALSERTLLSLLSNDPACNQAQPISEKYPQVTFAYMKHLWQGGQKQQAFSLLSEFVMTHQRPLLATAEDEDNTKLLSRYMCIDIWGRQAMDRREKRAILHVFLYCAYS